MEGSNKVLKGSCLKVVVGVLVIKRFVDDSVLVVFLFWHGICREAELVFDMIFCSLHVLMFEGSYTSRVLRSWKMFCGTCACLAELVV